MVAEAASTDGGVWTNLAMPLWTVQKCEPCIAQLIKVPPVYAPINQVQFRTSPRKIQPFALGLRGYTTYEFWIQKRFYRPDPSGLEKWREPPRSKSFSPPG